MRLVDLNLSRDELADRLGGASIGDASLRLPANYDLPLGESVLVRVRAPSMGHPVFLEGVVQWRRPQATRGQPSGTGVRLVAAAVPRWQRLRRWADGGGEAELRASERYPTRQAVILVTAPRGSTRIYPCALADVSLRGALLSINHRLEPGEQGRCEWAVGARTFAVTLTVAWSSQGRAGVRVIAEERAQTAAWEELVESVRTALDAQRVAPHGIIPRTDLTALADVTVRTERGAVPERAIVELPPGPTRRRDPRQG